MPLPYTLQVHSKPLKVPADTWAKWYTEEHIRDMVYFQASKTGASYEATAEIMTSGSFSNDGNEGKDFFALYQTDRKHCLDYPEYKENVRLKSRLFAEGATCHDVGTFSPTGLALVEVLGSYEYNESKADSNPWSSGVNEKQRWGTKKFSRCSTTSHSVQDRGSGC